MTAVVPATADAVLGSPSPVVGDVDGIEVVRGYAREAAACCGDGALELGRARAHLDGAQSAGAQRLGAVLAERVEPGLSALDESAALASTALAAYADEVDRIHAAARRCERETDEALDGIRIAAAEIDDIARAIGVVVDASWRTPPPGEMPEPSPEQMVDPALGSVPGLDAEERREQAVLALRARYADPWRRAAAAWRGGVDAVAAACDDWDALVEDRRRAERALTRGLTATPIGELLALGGGVLPATRLAVALTGCARGVWNAPAGFGARHPLLERLLGAPDGSGVWRDPPPPDRVAQAWRSLSPEERETLIREAPWAIGNLPGIPYAARDAANRLALEYAIVHDEELSRASGRAVDELMRVVAESAERDAPVQVVALDLTGSIPLVAVGYGDLDRADTVTWQVPGMANDAHRALRTWDIASRNLLDRQEFLDGDRDHAVVAFLAYDTPDLIDSLAPTGVLHNDAARAGAPRLAAELDGLVATRTGGRPSMPGFTAPGEPRVAVIGHSYGTTTAANALAGVRHPVDAFVLAGSAGIDPETVPGFDRLNVAEAPGGGRAITTSHASADALAPIGLALSGRANPNPNLRYGGSPNLAGARYAPADGAVGPDGEVYAPTDGHSVIGDDPPWYRVDGALRHRAGLDASEGHGYWDRGTQSLHNFAALSLGLEHQVIGGLHVASR